MSKFGKPMAVILVFIMAILTTYIGYSMLTDRLESTGTDLAVLINISIWIMIAFIGVGTIILTLFASNPNPILAGFGVPISLALFYIALLLVKALFMMFNAIAGLFNSTLANVILMILMYVLGFAILLGLPIGAFVYLLDVQLGGQ